MALQAWNRLFSITKRICSPVVFSESNISALRTASITCYQPIISRKYCESAEKKEKSQYDTGPPMPYADSYIKRRSKGRRVTKFSFENTDKVLRSMELKQKKREAVAIKRGMQFNPDMPIRLKHDPYEPEKERCVLCKCDVPVDYKNTQLLSQFVSPYTGLIYGRQKTGLCAFMQRLVSKHIMRARHAGFMPFTFKNRRYLGDPVFHDIFARERRRSIKRN